MSAAFAAFDRNGDGVISRDEFARAMNPTTIQYGGQTMAEPITGGGMTYGAPTTTMQYGGSLTTMAQPPMTYAAPQMIQEQQMVYQAPQQQVTYAAPQMIQEQQMVYQAPQQQQITYAAPQMIQEQQMVDAAPPVTIQAPPQTVQVIQAPPTVLQAAPVFLPPQPMAPPAPDLGGRVVGERAITREELYSTGNLVEGPAVMAERRQEFVQQTIVQQAPPQQIVYQAPQVIQEPQIVYQAPPRQVIQQPQMVYEAPPQQMTYAAPQVIQEQQMVYQAPQQQQITYAAPQMIQEQVQFQAQPQQITYAAPQPQMLQQMVYGAPQQQMVYGAPQQMALSQPVSTFNAFDTNGDGKIDRAEFQQAMGGRGFQQQQAFAAPVATQGRRY